MAFGTTIIIDLANTRNTFQSFLDDIVNKVAVLMNRAWVVRYPLNREPSDGVVIGSGCFESGLLSFIGVAVKLIVTVCVESAVVVKVGKNFL